MTSLEKLRLQLQQKETEAEPSVKPVGTPGLSMDELEKMFAELGDSAKVAGDNFMKMGAELGKNAMFTVKQLEAALEAGKILFPPNWREQALIHKAEAIGGPTSAFLSVEGPPFTIEQHDEDDDGEP